MAEKYFTYEEAQTLLPILESLLRASMEAKDTIQTIEAEFQELRFGIPRVLQNQLKLSVPASWQDVHLPHCLGQEQVLPAKNNEQEVLAQLGRDQKQTLLDLCIRREQLRVQDRARLFGAVADYFKAVLETAPARYQSDEKFVLQMIAVLAEESGMQPAAAGRVT